METGNLGEAETALLRAQQGSSHLPCVAGFLAYCYVLQGRREKALSIAARLRRLARSRYVSPLHMARMHAAFNEFDQAFEFLESSRLHRCCRVAELLLDPVFERLRDDSRFSRMLRCVGLPEGPLAVRNTA
jgi:hypothetical protein